MKYFLGFLASIGLVIFVIILIVRGFSGGGKKHNLPTPLSDYTNTSVQMQYVMAGPVNADQNHKSLRITVGEEQTKIEALQGYNDAVSDTRTYVNNQAAYGEFLRALDIAGYTRGNTDTGKKDERGYCPTGYRYSFDIVDGASTKQHFWATSCNQGTFKGSSNQVRNLFQAQIPDYGKDSFVVN